MFEIFSRIINIKELRGKLIATALLLVVFRIGKFIPVPGIDVGVLSSYIESMQQGALGKVLAMADMFTGGAMAQGAIFGLGIMPYISASIVFQLLVAVIPSLSRIAHEGAVGRKKINQYVRVSTLGLCLVQAGSICAALLAQSADARAQGHGALVSAAIGRYEFYFFGILALTVGTMFLMWLGEQIDQFGIGNGISLIIMAGIISRMPAAVGEMCTKFSAGGENGVSIGTIAVIALLFVGMTLAVVLLTLGTRRVPVQQSKAVRGRKVYSAQRNFLPLRVNQSGVIPIIFAQAILQVVSLFAQQFAFLGKTFSPGEFWYTILYIIMIMFFCYFYTAITFNPNEIADNLKQSGMYIPGIRPGKRTAEHLEKIMTRIALAGSIFLSFVAIIPQFITGTLHVSWQVSGMLGGTGLLIVVGVALDVVQRVESYMLMKNYEGFGVGGGRMKGRRSL